MWKIVHIADNKEEAEKIKEQLNSRGFLLKIEQSDSNNFQIKAPESEMREVHETLLQIC